MKTDLTSLLPRFHMSNIQRYSPPGCGSGLSWNRRKYIVFMETTYVIMQTSLCLWFLCGKKCSL